jgi:hypothetical protein
MTDPFADDLFGQPVRGGGAKPEDMEGKLVSLQANRARQGSEVPGARRDRRSHHC